MHMINYCASFYNKIRLRFPVLTASIILTLLVCGSSTVSALYASQGRNPEPLTLTDGQGKYPLGLHLQILEDPGGKLTIEDVSSPSFSERFAPSRAQNPVYGFTDSAYWVRLELNNETSQQTDWVMTVNFANMHYVDLYTSLPDESGFSVKKSGTLRPVSGRDIIFPRIAFELIVPTDAHQTYFLRFQNGASMTLGMTLFTMKEYMRQSQQVLLLYGFLFGALCALIAYHIFLLVTLRELSYLYFVLLLFCLLITLLIYDGYIPAYVFPNVNAMPLYVFPVADIGLYMSIALFSASFLEIKNFSRKLYWANMVVIGVGGIMILLVFLTSFGMMARWVTTWSLAVLVVVLVSGLASWLKGYQPAAIFMISWLALVVSLVLLEVVRKGILPSSFFVENSFQPAFIIMAVGWSMALADRINVLKTQTVSAYKSLRNSEHEVVQILDGIPVGVVVYGKDEMPKYANQQAAEILGNPKQGIQPDIRAGRNLAQALDYFSFHIVGTSEKYPLEQMPVYRALQGHSVSVDDLEANLVDRLVPIEMWASPILDETGNVVSAVAAFLDITERKQTEAELAEYRKLLESLVEKRTADLSAINDWLTTINELQQTIGGLKDVPAAYQKLSTTIARLIEARAVCIVHWGEQFEHCEVHFDSGDEVSLSHQILNKLKTSVVRDHDFYEESTLGKPIVLAADQRSNYSIVFGDMLTQEDLQLFILAPMITHQKIGGLIGIVFRNPEMEISQQQMLLMEKMAVDVTDLTRNAYLLDQSIELATLEERQRIARDLHDSVSQMLFSASMFSSILPQRIRRDPQSALETADELRRLTRGALAEMRTLLLELRPAGITRVPLRELMVQLTEAISGRSEFSLEVDLNDFPPLPEDVQIVFYRITQEALNNIAKHAEAKHVLLRLTASPSWDSSLLEDWHGEVCLNVKDDGIGFDSGMLNYEHFGLGIMQERAMSIQAQFRLQSEPGKGTEVILIWLKA